MHSIKKIILRVLLIVAVLVVFEMGIKYAYEPYNVTVHATKQEKKQMDGTIETVFCGTSLLRSTNLDYVDEQLNTISFNVGSSCQMLDGSYYMIKDTVEKNPVKRIFLTASMESLTKQASASKWKALVFDGMESGKNKMGYLLNGVGMEEWPYMLLYSVRVEDYLEFSAVKENFNIKKTDEYWQGMTHTSLYRGRGRFGRENGYTCKVVDTLEKNESTFTSDTLQEHQEKYLKKLMKYCKDREIELIIVHTPVTKDRINEYKDYEPIHEYYQKITEEYGVPFWDFNYYQELEKIFTEDLFEDEKHLNVRGGDVFAEKLIEVYQSYQNGDGVEQYFLEECPYYYD